jgi:hypothetical protein
MRAGGGVWKGFLGNSRFLTKEFERAITPHFRLGVEKQNSILLENRCATFSFAETRCLNGLPITHQTR